MSLVQLNTMTKPEAIDWFALTCTASAWCKVMADTRPYHSLDALIDAATSHWSTMTPDDIHEALAGHPMIGDLTTLKAKYANTQSLAKHEQGGMQQASEAVLLKLKQLNERYLAKHGFIFIICASGLSAQQMLAAIEKRIDNATDVEFATAANEQLKITILRITKALKDAV